MTAGDWGYPNTDALGLDEYFYWCEDLGLEPVLGVWAGFSLDSAGGTPFTGDALQPYVDDVLNELEVSCYPIKNKEIFFSPQLVYSWRLQLPIRCIESSKW